MKSVQKPGTASLYVIHVTRNSTNLVFPWRFHLEQLIKEMEGRAPDLLDAMATVTVPVSKEDEVKCLQCVWYVVKWWVPSAGKKKLMTIIRCVEHSNCKMHIILLTKGNFLKIRLELKVVTEWKKCHFYFILFSEAKSKSWNNISLKISQCEPSIFVFYPKKKIASLI